MNLRAAAIIGVPLVALAAVAAIPILDQPREKSGVRNTSPEFLAKRQEQREYMEEARRLLEMGKAADAEVMFRKADAVFPNGRAPDAETGIAEALAQQGRIQEAVQIYRGTVEEFGQGWPELLLKYGRMCDRAGLQAEALAAYRRAFAVQDPDSFPVRLPPNASDAEVRQRAQAAIRTYHQGAPDWQVQAERKMRTSGE